MVSMNNIIWFLVKKEDSVALQFTYNNYTKYIISYGCVPSPFPPGILPKEKPLEIKTVRIVKRESTERRKDRTGGKRVSIGDSSLTHLLEDDVESDGVLSDAENEPPLPSFAAR